MDQVEGQGDPVIEIGPDPPVYSFNRLAKPRCVVESGSRVRIRTSDAIYRKLTGDELDRRAVPTHRFNALSGPIAVAGAEPGDALLVRIEAIELDPVAHAVYIAWWRRETFGLADSRVDRLPIRDGQVDLGSERRIAVRPMVGCIGVAPASGELAALSPTGPTGGNMDLVELGPGATLWLPVQAPGALLSLGDLHAAMGRGEPTGAGLECAGLVTVRLELRRHRPLSEPRVETSHGLHFVGTDPAELDAAIAAAVRAAWLWLTTEQRVASDLALQICAALLDVDLGGPAGANAVASFEREALRSVGIEPEFR